MTSTEPSRREMILDAAVALFRTRGFHGAGIDEIGAAAGISGPGVYRHFPNKHALLVAMSQRVTDRLLVHNSRVKEEESDPTAALARLVRTHVSFVLGSQELISVYVQEERSLPEPDRKEIRAKQDRYLNGWVEFLERLAPAADPADLREVVQTVIGMINSVSHPGSRLASTRETLERMAMAALMAGAGAITASG
ncbi:MAG: TetR/AcrR family transcriptional regulator, partial [Acidimicrobiia bacterium]|nr:TetR/AcrR family transcriptional regulator [Acidimicrobiia bacterium]